MTTEEKLDHILDLFEEHEACEEWHIHASDDQLANDTHAESDWDEHKNFDKGTAKSALLALINEERLKLASELIGENEAPIPNPMSKNIHERIGTCWACYGEDYCVHAIRDDFRNEQRAKLQTLSQGGKNDE